jgi:hypothetical protein
VAFKLQARREQLESDYASVKLAYANIDALLPGVLPKVWDAVLDKRNVALFNPLKNPDVGAWLKVVIRLVMMRQARVVNASYAADAVNGFLQKAWVTIKKGLGTLKEIVKIVGPAVVGSTGVSGHRALELAQQRLKELGVVDVLAIVMQIRRCPRTTGSVCCARSRTCGTTGRSSLISSEKLCRSDSVIVIIGRTSIHLLNSLNPQLAKRVPLRWLAEGERWPALVRSGRETEDSVYKGPLRRHVVRRRSAYLALAQHRHRLDTGQGPPGGPETPEAEHGPGQWAGSAV